MVLEDLLLKGKGFFRRTFVPLLASSALLLSCGDGDNKNPVEPVENQSRVYELSNVELNAFSEVEKDKVVLSKPKNYSPGDVIVGGISEKTPNGILVEVTGISSDGTVVQTKPASLEQVIEGDSFTFNQPILPGDETTVGVGVGKVVSVQSADFSYSYNFENVILAQNSSGGRLALNGSLSFNLVPNIEAVWKDRYIKAQINLEQEVDLRLVSDLDFRIDDFQKSYPLLNLVPIPVPGTIIVLTPSIDIVVGVFSGLSADLEANLFQRASLTPGLAYVNGDWKNITGFENQFEFSVNKVMSPLEVEVYAGPYIKLHFNDYGLLLPAVQGGISGNLQFEFEFDNWSFWGGLAANIGVDPSRFFELFVSPYNKKVLEKKKLLTEGMFGENLSVYGSEFTDVEEDGENVGKEDSGLTGGEGDGNSNLNVDGVGEISPSELTGRIAFISGYDICLINPNGSDRKTLIQEDKSISGYSWSSNGTEIVYSTGAGDMILFNLESANRTVLISKGGGAYNHLEYPSFSPNGDRIAYSDGSIHPGSIYSLDLLSLVSTRIYPLGNNDLDRFTGISWSPHQAITFSTRSQGGLFKMNSDGTGLEEVGVDAGGGRESIFAIYHPSVSPDGKKIAFSTMRFRVTSKTEDSWTYSPGLPDIWVENIDGFGAVNLTDSPTQIDYHPSWSPDGKWITYGSKERLNGNANIWIMNLQNSNRFQLTDESSECHSPYWSPR